MEYIGRLYFLFAVGFVFLHACSCFPVDPKETEVVVFSAISQSWIGILLLGIVFLVVSVFLVAGCLCCRGSTYKEFRNSVSSTNLTGVGVGVGFVNSNLGGTQSGGNELAIFPPPGVNTTSVTFEPLPNIVPPLQQQQQQQLISRNKPPSFNTSPSQDFSIKDWFAKEANFPRDQLHYLRECGRGWFGRVVEGEARGVGEGGRSCKVVVRILREDATPSEQKFFLNEVKPFRDLSHPNILKLVGRCLDTEPFLILLESCSSGDLKSFLCGNVASRSALCEQGICLRMMCDVATGLQHMHENGFVHTDLAARNCLVTSDLQVKVGDYGTSIETYKDDYYIAGDMAIPIRWCSPESLHCTDTTIETKQVTACANVWSFGVLLWEVCEFGALPYTSLSDEQVIVRVLGKEGLILPPPTYPSLHTAHLYSLMQMCWRDENQRATLDHVIAMLKHLQVSRILDSEDDFERRWETLKPNTIPVTDNQKLDVVTLKSDFDSGVDLDVKSADLDISKRKSSDVSPATTSPQLSVASSSGGDFFTPSATLKRQLSPSLTNLRGSLEDIPVQIATSEEHSPQHTHTQSDTEQFDSWLKGVDTTNEEDVKFVKKISEAIRDLDDALALEKTSSSSEASSKHGSPIKEPSTSDQNPTLDFRLGLITNISQLDSLQDDNLGIRQDSSSDTEEETWRGRVERGEFSEKVKEKSRSVADLMILTHIENSEGSDESDSLPSLTRQYSIEKSRRLGHNRPGPYLTTMTTIGFGSEGNIRGAVLGEEFQESLKQLQSAWKIRDAESRNASLTLEDINRIPAPQQTTKGENREVNFLGDEASEKEPDKEKNLESSSDCNNVNNSVTSHIEDDDRFKKSFNEHLGELVVESKEVKKLCENDNSLTKISNPVNNTNESLLNDSEHLLPQIRNEIKSETVNKENKDVVNRVPVRSQLVNISPDFAFNKEFKDSIFDTVQVIENESLSNKLLTENSKKDVDAVKEKEMNVESQQKISDFENNDLFTSKEVKDSLIQFLENESLYSHLLLKKNSIEDNDLKENIKINIEQQQKSLALDNKELSCEIEKNIISAAPLLEKESLDTSLLPKKNSNEDLQENCKVNVKCEQTLLELENKKLFTSPEVRDSIINTVEFLCNESEHQSSLLTDNSNIGVDLKENNQVNLEFQPKLENEELFLKDLEENDLFCSKPIDEINCYSKELIDENLLDKDVLNSVADSNNISVQELLDSKETSLSELESSSQSSEQVTTVVENDLTKTDESSELNSPCDTAKNIPQIVVTEVNELDMSINENNIENIYPGVNFKPRKFRILISNDIDTDTDNDNDSIDGENNENDDGNNCDQDKLEDILTSAVKNRMKRSIENEGNFLEDFEISDIDLRKSFDSNSVNIYNFKEKNCGIDKLKLSNLEPKHETIDSACTLNSSNISSTNESNSNNNISVNQYSVILGSCEDYTLDYFKGLKTTNGKQMNCSDIDYSKNDSNGTDECEVEDTDKDDNINNWDRFLTNSLKERMINEDSFRNIQFDHNQHLQQQGLDSLSSSQTDMTSEDTVIEDQNEDEVSERLNKINLDFSDRESNVVHVDNCIINNDYQDNRDIFISENIDRNFNLYNDYSNQDRDIQMNEVKTRLENVAKFSEGFKLKSEGGADDEEDEGKLLTPDDERSSDSGFRDKGSLSESVEDACDEKYNLEDIEAELEEAYTKKESKYFALQDEISSSSGEFCAQSNFPSNSCTLQCSNDTLVDLEEPSNVDNRKEDEHENNTTSKTVTEPNSEESDEVQCLSTFNEFQEEKTTGWYLHPPSSNYESTESSGWYPVPVAQDSNRDDTSYVSFHLDEEFVTAIRNELKEKLPCAQQQSITRKDGEEESTSPEEERADMVIEYGNYPVPLSPILEERESVSSNQSSLILDLQGSNETSGRSSPVLLLERRNSMTEASKNFEEDIKIAMNLCKSESLESDDAAIVLVDLEEKKQMKVKEEYQEDCDDLLIVDTETNEARLLESPRPKSHLAFVSGQKVIDKSNFPETSPSINTDTFTPDSISPVSSRSSRTGVALSFSSTDTGNLSNFLSPSSLHSEFVDSGPPSLPFDLGETGDEVEQISIGPTNIAAEIIDDLHELGVIKDYDINQKNSETPISKLDFISLSSNKDDTLYANDISSNKCIEKTEEVVTNDKSNNHNRESDVSKQEILLNLPLFEDLNPEHDNSINKLSPNFSLDDLLISDKDSYIKNNPLDVLENSKALDDSEDWLKSVLFPLTRVSSDLVIENPKDIEHCLPVTVLSKESWPSSDELIPESVQIEKQQIQEQEAKKSQNSECNSDSSVQDSDKKCKTLDLNSTLALSSPNFPFGPDSNSSMVSSFSSTPTFDTTKSLADIQMSLSISSNDGEDSIKIVPSLRFLASEVLRINKKVLTPLPASTSLDNTVQSKKMNNLTLALDTAELQSKAPMPSPEDADKGTWRPTISQLLDLTNQNDHELENDDLMTTSFIERDCDGDRYTPDWESDMSDAESEDHSSSSGEFIWKPQDDVHDKGMECIDEEDEDEIADDSSSASATEFIPSTWDHGATPSKSALRTPDKKQDSLKRVCFKKQKYHCVYEYPREPSESEDDDIESPTRRSWQTTDPQNFDCFADWELGDCELDNEVVDTDSEESLYNRSKSKTAGNNSQNSDVDIYRLSGFDYDLAQMTTDDGEFFISSSARPFHQLGSSSEFFPGRLQQSLDTNSDNQSFQKDDNKKESSSINNACENFIEHERKSGDEQLGVGGLRHTREWLKLDLPNPAGDCTSATASNILNNCATTDTATSAANTISVAITSSVNVKSAEQNK
ncbi:uncharacterized protein LOC142330294 isoform X2 [Lycorma delicatula]|uniref:uncharacterized protein LOC142330294 isoform X2 n=1 Tax=Lycorma delicatula TaxID=130591 RepID=UPI003F510B38